MDIVDRMFELIDQKYKEQKDFAEKIGVNASRISEWRNRKSTSFQRRLPEIAIALNTTTEYLLTGEKATLEPEDGLNRKERNLIYAYRRADDRAKAMVELALEPFMAPRQSETAV